MLRLSNDFHNEQPEGFPNLWFEGRRLADVAAELGVTEGMPVVVFYRDPEEEFEFEGRLQFHKTARYPDGEWFAVVEENSFRRLK